MKKYCIFIDESGMSNPKMYKVSPYFSLCGLVLNEYSRDKIKKDLDLLKIKYFKKNIILHSSELRRMLKTRENIESFANDLGKILKKHSFFLLFVVIENEKAMQYSWNSVAIYRKTYREIIGNLIKFLIAKDSMGTVSSEASNVSQDIALYQSLFHYIANGIPKLGIKPSDVKGHLTAVSFVTKANNDIEEQLADLLAYMGKVSIEIKKGTRKEVDLDPIEKLLYGIINRNLFGKNKATKPAKIKLYNSINSFSILP